MLNLYTKLYLQNRALLNYKGKRKQRDLDVGQPGYNLCPAETDAIFFLLTSRKVDSCNYMPQLCRPLTLI